jgi:hypothetical protein
MIIDQTLVRKKKFQKCEKVHRTWMCFSPKKGSLFCFCCTLFNQNYPNQRGKFNSENGFTTWHKLNPRIQDHENSPAHCSSFPAWKELECGLNKSGLIDDHLQQQIAKAAKKWREILECITVTVQTLAKQNLPLQGHRESLVSDPNPGNFLGLLTYLAKFDPVMREHLDSVSGESGCLSYFSPDIQNELINLLGARVHQTIISSIQKTKYYSIIFDTTQDNAHIEQMSQIVRFI